MPTHQRHEHVSQLFQALIKIFVGDNEDHHGDLFLLVEWVDGVRNVPTE